MLPRPHARSSYIQASVRVLVRAYALFNVGLHTRGVRVRNKGMQKRAESRGTYMGEETSRVEGLLTMS